MTLTDEVARFLHGWACDGYEPWSALDPAEQEHFEEVAGELISIVELHLSVSASETSV